MNKELVSSGSKVVKAALKVSIVFIILGLIIGTFGLSNANASGNYYEIGAGQVQEQYLGYFDLGEDVQLGLSISDTTHNQNRVPNSGFDSQRRHLLRVQILSSESSDFTEVKTIFSGKVSEIYRDFSADQGYHQLVISNLSDYDLGYFVLEAHSSTSTLLTVVIGMVLVGIGFAILGMTITITFQVLFVLAIFYIVKSIWENEQRKREKQFEMMNRSINQS